MPQLDPPSAHGMQAIEIMRNYCRIALTRGGCAVFRSINAAEIVQHRPQH
jgi:hypothetical protein